MRTWIIGSGGLFGSALARASSNLFLGPSVPWEDDRRALEVLRGSLSEFARDNSGPWSIVWAAGRATTSTNQTDADRERDFFGSFIEHVAKVHPTGPGAFVLTSSAGGAYAGSNGPPFSSSTKARPVGVYGHLKVAQEQIVERLSPHLPVLTLRVSNLYGPGQDLSKLQGLISRLALAAVTREPITMFVPLDTMRDFIFVDDAARRAMYWTKKALREQASSTRVIGSGQPETLAHIIAMMNDIARVRVPVASGMHYSARAQAHDLRLSPDVDEYVQRLPLTPLPDGMKRVFLDIRQRHAQAVLSA